MNNKTKEVVKNIKPVYGVSYLTRAQEYATHNITNIHIDNRGHMVQLTIEKGLNINQVTMSMEHAQNIGFINIDVLKCYCK